MRAVRFFFRFFGVDELEEFHEDIVTSRRELDGTDFFFQIEPTLGGNIFVSDFFSTSAASRPIFFPDYWNKTADFWESLRSFRSSQSTAESVFI